MQRSLHTHPTASIIVCVFNRGRPAIRCLDSVLASDYEDFEIVIVDDCSTDDTCQRLAEFRDDHPERNITVVRNDTNLGVSGARNRGIDAARGEYVFFTDSDCTVDPSWLPKLVSGFDSPNVMAVAGMVLNDPPTNWVERAYVGGTQIQRSSHQNRTLVGGNMGFRRDFILRYRFDNAVRYGGDEDDVALRMKANGRSVNFVQEAVVYHHHPLNLRSYLRMAGQQGKGAAWLWYKHGIYIGRDVMFTVACLLTTALGVVDIRLLVVPACFAILQMAAMAYNQVVFKGKSAFDALWLMPVDLVYNAVKTWNVVRTLLSTLVGREPRIRESRQEWLECRRRSI